MKANVCPTCNGSGTITKPEKSDLLILFEEIINILETPRTKATTGRLNKLKLRLKTFTETEIITATVSLSQSAWHMGDNPSNTKYASFDFLVRNDEQVDKWLGVQYQPREDKVTFA